MTFFDTLKRLQTITVGDLQYKSRDQLFASMIEEMGELAEAVLVAENTFGREHKKAANMEGPLGEIVDVMICALCLHVTEPFVKVDETDLHILVENTAYYFKQPSSQEPFLEIKRIARYVGEERYGSTVMRRECIALFRRYGGTQEQYESLISTKIDKWERQHKAALARRHAGVAT